MMDGRKGVVAALFASSIHGDQEEEMQEPSLLHAYTTHPGLKIQKPGLQVTEELG
jgi:hypothetical protein